MNSIIVYIHVICTNMQTCTHIVHRGIHACNTYGHIIASCARSCQQVPPRSCFQPITDSCIMFLFVVSHFSFFLSSFSLFYCIFFSLSSRLFRRISSSFRRKCCYKYCFRLFQIRRSRIEAASRLLLISLTPQGSKAFRFISQSKDSARVHIMRK